MIRLVLLLALLASPLAASDYPALHNVRDVASNDVLNIRAEPTASAPIVAALSFAAENVEVISLSGSGTWGLVNTGDGAGWVSMRYLARQPMQDWSRLPESYSCFGTEPFWSLLVEHGAATFELMGEPQVTLAVHGSASSANLRGTFAALYASATSAQYAATIKQAACSDGMSDRAYGLTVDLSVIGPTGLSGLYSGCCTLALQ